MNVLILSWEYPPIVAGGLARHVRKLTVNLVDDVELEVHVLTRGARDTPA
jgi:glycogen(starch) synthase